MNAFEEDSVFRPSGEDCKTGALCPDCAVYPLRQAAGCDPGSACVRTTYARHIDRFFRNNPFLALRFWQDEYFEVRAIVTRYLPAGVLRRMMRDADETVRMNVALFLPAGDLVRMMEDRDREVRIRVAGRLPESLLRW